MKSLVLIIDIDGIEFVIYVCDEEILPSISVEVSRIHPHAGACPATFAEANARLQCDFIPIPVAIGARASIHEQKILHSIVSDDKVYSAIILAIGGTHSQSFS